MSLRGVVLPVILIAGLVRMAVGGEPLVAQAAAASPEALARAAASAWARQDARALEGLLAAGGLTLRLDGQGHTGVSARQARASLEAFFSRYDTGQTRVRRVAGLGGDPPRGFAELEWRTAPSGSRETRDYVIFLGLALGGDRWRIVEIRIVS
jgi:hypothetical protein